VPITERELGEFTLTAAEAAALLHVSPSAIRRWTAQGRLPGIRAGGARGLRLRPVDVLALVERTPAPDHGSE
jgi:excisionase family DNA binding protein